MSVCADCVIQNGRSCCEVEEGERLTTLTFSDIERIEAATGVPGHRFVELERLSPDEAQAYEEARPIYRGLFATGIRYGLKARHGACVFLEKDRGCVLDEEIKPTACRLFPFDLDALGRLTLVDAPCLAVDRADGKAALLRLFGTTEDRVRSLLDRAQAEVRAHVADRRRRSG